MADPDGPVVLVEPFGLGGGPDIVARVLAPRLTEIWGVPVEVNNRAGAGATAAPAFVAAARADGRTLLLNTSAHAYSAALVAALPYDPGAFVAIAPVSSQPYVLVAASSTGIRTLSDLVREGQAKLRFASSGVGTATHVGVAQLNAELGISASHLSAGPTDAGADTAGRVAAGAGDYAMAPISMAEPLIASGAVFALGVSTSRRSRRLPDVPTLSEAGAPGFDFPIWYGIWAPSATPTAIVRRLAAAIAQTLEAPELRAWLLEHDADPMSMSQPEFSAFVARETERARQITV